MIYRAQRVPRLSTAFSKEPPRNLRKRPRERAEAHLRAIRALPCAICGSHRDVHAAHLRLSSARYGKLMPGTGSKPDDSWVSPLCRQHHNEQHDIGEEVFWAKYGIDPFVLTLALWRASGDEEMMEQIIAEFRRDEAREGAKR